MSLYKKINEVMQKITYLQKDDKISFGNTNYKAISEEKVTTEVRKIMVELGLVIIPIGVEMTKDGNLTSVHTKYKIVDIETGEHEILESVGQGADTQDKGSGKAMTYAYKYLLLRTFAIPTGEDPDKISNAELDEQQKGTTTTEDKPSKATIKAKYQVLGWKMEEFETWYAGQRKKFKDPQIDKFLTSQIAQTDNK